MAVFRLFLPIVLVVLVCLVIIAIIYLIIYWMRIQNNNKKPPAQNAQDNLEFHDLTNESLYQEIINNQKEVKNNLIVIKYCMIFFVVLSIFIAAFGLIAYLIHLLS